MSLLKIKKKLNLMQSESPKKILQTDAMISSNITNNSNYNINNNSSKYNKNFNNNKNHIIITSKETPKKVPNLIKNVHHRPKVANSCDNFKFQPISSFELKLSKELGRISNGYTQIKNRKFFNKQTENTNIYWQNFPDYEIYRQLKELETRKEIPLAFPKPRLKPLICNTKDRLGKLAKNLYEADQIDRFKSLLNKYKINQRKKK